MHRRAWRRIRDEDLAGAILIEDGARLVPGFVDFIESGGYLHADLTQFCYGRARVWRWGGCDASPGVRLRPLAACTGLSAGYSLSRRGARQLLEAAGASRDARDSAAAEWPRDVARLDTLVSRPRLVEAPDWLADAIPREPVQEVPAERGRGAGWRDLSPASLSHGAAQRLRGFARTQLSRDLSSGF
ncbi:hypothetical protein [Paracoccus salsus]|uniref:hypothetical protein n=1 Tax=Paracoccus salsus TaxID=2911061 RepID=UPI001F321FF2|nr:hypothetical protein [Paracoccus salsus]MCF3972201.1 hypothetical protein [Paracoccus salsus]